MIKFFESEEDQPLRQRIDARVRDVFQHGQYILGPEVFEFERLLASFSGRKFALGVANGTDALVLSLLALRIGPGSKVLTPGFSFISAVEAIVTVGATLILMDVDYGTCNIDGDYLSQIDGSEIDALVSVNLFGQCPNYDSIQSWCSKFEVLLIEDAAQSFGATWNDRKSLSFGDISCTSFFPTKPLGCFGDGGAVLTDSEELFDRLKSLRSHGQNYQYQYSQIGMNSRLDSIQAAVLIEKINYFDRWFKRRTEVAKRYHNLLVEANVDKFIERPTILELAGSVWAQYTLKIPKKRTEVQKRLKAFGIPFKIYYPKPLGEGCYESKTIFNDPLRSCYSLASDVLSLPLHNKLTDADQQVIVSILKETAE